MAKNKRNENEPTIIKKYANRRLYDTGRSSYVTLSDLCEMVKEGHDFVVLDAKSGADITRPVLTQIIVEQEAQDEESLLPTSFLRNLIGFYGENMQNIVPNYLDQTFEMFASNQDKLREQLTQSLHGIDNNPIESIFSGAPSLEEMQRKNMEVFENTMKMFSNFSGAMPSPSASEKPTANTQAKEDKINALKDNIAAMKDEIDRLAQEA